MRRVTLSASVMLRASVVRDLLDGKRQRIREVTGQVHDGQQLVLRVSPGLSPSAGYVVVEVEVAEWDHGGDVASAG